MSNVVCQVLCSGGTVTKGLWAQLHNQSIAGVWLAYRWSGSNGKLMYGYNSMKKSQTVKKKSCIAEFCKRYSTSLKKFVVPLNPLVLVTRLWYLFNGESFQSWYHIFSLFTMCSLLLWFLLCFQWSKQLLLNYSYVFMFLLEQTSKAITFLGICSNFAWHTFVRQSTVSGDYLLWFYTASFRVAVNRFWLYVCLSVHRNCSFHVGWNGYPILIYSCDHGSVGYFDSCPWLWYWPPTWLISYKS